jgi:hypothetical protein
VEHGRGLSAAMSETPNQERDAWVMAATMDHSSIRALGSAFRQNDPFGASACGAAYATTQSTIWETPSSGHMNIPLTPILRAAGHEV